jgi:ADP-heptose:LPS heptosyltransferase
MVWSARAAAGAQQSDYVACVAVPYVRGWGLDIGCGPRVLWPHMVGVDVAQGQKGTAARFMLPAFEAPMPWFSPGAFDYVFSSHHLDRIPDWQARLTEWWNLIKVGGHLVLYLPHRDLAPAPGEEGAEDRRHALTPGRVLDAMATIALTTGYTVLEDELRGRGDEFSFFLVLQKRDDGVFVDTPWKRDPERQMALVCRYGEAIGDHILAASVLPLLKRAGYHVTVNCTPHGHHILKHDPNIDAFWLQDTGEIPGDMLHIYWEALRREGRWDYVVNLNSVVEDWLLTPPNHPRDTEPHAVRHAVRGHVSYLEATHDYAGVPHEFAPRFFPTKEEADAAEAWRVQIGTHVPVIAFPMVGSAFHKVYPHADHVALWCLTETPAHIVIFGDGGRGKVMAQAVVAQLMKHDAPMHRVHVHAGDLNIRDVLARAMTCNVIAGPETGILWAVATKASVGKVVYLSHSSETNFAKHWKRTVALSPHDCPCFPCHRLHYFDAMDRCTIGQRNEIEGSEHFGTPEAALCATNIEPRDVVKAIMGLLRLHVALPAA